MAELRHLASTCSFNNFWEEALRDRLVCGMANEPIQKRLLTEANLTLKNSLEISLGMELAAKGAQELQGKGSNADAASLINKVGKKVWQQKPKCPRCGKRNHKSDCFFKSAECLKCGRKGYVR